MSAIQSKAFRTALFGSTYFTQGSVFAFLSTFNAIYLRSFGVPYDKIGLAAGIAMTPFLLKVFIGMLSDKVNLFHLGHRRPFIALGILMQAAGLVLISTVNPEASFQSYVAALTLILLGMSTYDTTTDGLAIDVTPLTERGFVQGIMVSAKALAQVLLAVVLGLLIARVSWAGAFYFIALLSLPALVLVWFAKEAPRSADKQFAFRNLRSLIRPRVGWFLLLGIIQPIAIYSSQSLITVFLNETVGVTVEGVGFYGSLLGIGTIAGGLFGARLADRVGRRTTLLASVAAASLSLAILGLVGSRWAAVVTVMFFGLCFGLSTTAYFATAMDLVDKRVAATMFAVMMAAGNIGIALGQPLAGFLIEGTGFRWMFFTLAVVNLVNVPLVLLVFSKRRSRVKVDQHDGSPITKAEAAHDVVEHPSTELDIGK